MNPNSRLRSHCLVLCAGLLTLLQSGCGSFSYAMKAPDKAQAFRHPLIISLLGSRLAIQRTGFTIFESKAEKVAVPDWGLDEMVEKLTAQRLQQEGIVARTANPALRDAVRSQAWSKLIEAVDSTEFDDFVRQNRALLGGADSVVFIEGHPGQAMGVSGGARPPALIYYSIDNNVTYCGTVRVHALAAPDGRQLSWAHGNDTGTQHDKMAFTSWATASTAQRDEIHQRIVNLTQQSLREALTRAGL